MAASVARVAELFWTGMLVHLWQTTLVLAVLWVLARAMQNAPARSQAALWWIGVLKLFLPLTLLSPLASRALAALVGRFDSGSASSQVEWISATFWLYPVTLQASVETPSSPIGLFCSVLFVAWFAGLGWILFRRLRRWRRDARLPLMETGKGRQRLESKIRAALAPTGIPQGTVNLVRGSGIPSVRGLFRPRIEIPSQVAERLEVADLTAVLLHEDEHRRRKDPLRQVLAALASWLFFFYPPLRWLLRRVHETTEMACDEAVLKAGIAPRDYARSIARTLELGLGPVEAQPAFIGPGRSSIRRRLARLEGKRSYRIMFTHRIILAVAALIALLGSIVPLSPATQAESEKPSPVSAHDRFVVLDRLAVAGDEVTLSFNQVAVEKVLDALSQATGFKLELDPAVGERPITVELERGTLREALVRLAEMANLYYEVPDAGTLRVGKILLPGVDGVTSPVRIEKSAVRPVYPEALRQAKLQGRAVLQAVIDADGTVRDVEVLASDHPAFSESAITALRQWRYEPATLEDKPVGVYFTIVVEFELNGGKKTMASEGGPTL